MFQTLGFVVKKKSRFGQMILSLNLKRAMQSITEFLGIIIVFKSRI